MQLIGFSFKANSNSPTLLTVAGITKNNGLEMWIIPPILIK
jgi:hypothetical protein